MYFFMHTAGEGSDKSAASLVVAEIKKVRALVTAMVINLWGARL